MPTTQQLREQRANVWSQLTEIMDIAEREGRDLTAEERAKYDSGEGDLDRLGNDIERQERHEARKAELEKVDRSAIVPTQRSTEEEREERGAAQEKQYRDAFTDYLRGGLGNLDREARGILVGGREKESRALAEGSPSAGGYLVPTVLRDQIVTTLKTFGGMVQASQVVNTATGATLYWPTANDTANAGFILAEDTQVTDLDVSFGTASIGAYKYTSGSIRVPIELEQDSAFPIDSWIIEQLGVRIGRIYNTHFTTGTGVNQPLGIVTNSVVGKTGATGQTTTVIYDDLVDLIDSLDPAYQSGAQFMMSQQTRKAIRKLKDSQQHPLWQPSIQAGMPDQLLGYGYVINQDMPVPAASAKSILFGNFQESYLVRQVLDFSVLRLSERYADYAQTGFMGFSRASGTVQNYASYRAYQHPAS